MAVLFRPKRPSQFGGMAGVGHEERFRLRRQKGCRRLEQPTFAGTLGNARDAPIPELAVILHNLDGFDSKHIAAFTSVGGSLSATFNYIAGQL